MADQHARLAPSASKRWMNCPGCINLGKDIEEKDSEYAAEGTAAHAMGEHCLKTEKRSTSGLFAPDFLQPEHRKWVDQEMMEAIQLYIDTIWSDKDKFGGDLNVEQNLNLDWLVKGMFGKSDANLGEDFGLLRIYDLKYGKGVLVDAEYNPQQMIYALGVLGKHNPHSFMEVEIVIIQPRAFHVDGPVRRWRVPVDELYSFGNVVRARAKDTEDPNAYLRPGEWCQFCKCLPVCPAVVKQTTEAAMVEFDKLPDSTLDFNLPTPEALTISQLSKALSISKLIATWLNSAEQFVQAKMESGVVVPGWKLVKKRGNRKWKDEDDVVAALENDFGDDIYKEPVLRSPAEMEKLIGVDKKKLEALWETPETGNTIAPVEDKRPAVHPSAKAEFSDSFLT